eukprot:CAMPEP_0204608824 /NCGR_PEP_ID=MMETSP0661-20131031/60546_1 /ASSEMBLY_ACC=CAM_ASM_000606 /TAXON_ID=109239 /ORGANISM="Alexandrium margalefi, Strain AMGDE01CS-322" /LENGTH=250 /DNA_ID=CAMNT_0051620407 /DNA_START=376 /DNA_END=1129 /DNA_ORIENTATION=-
MESVPEVVRGYRPKEEPYDARAPGRMEDVQCLKVLGILWMQAVPELCHAERPHTGVAKLHPDYSESVVLRDDPLVHLVDRKAQQLPHVDPDVVLALRPSGRQHEDARALPGSAVAPPGELLVHAFRLSDMPRPHKKRSRYRWSRSLSSTSLEGRFRQPSLASKPPAAAGLTLAEDFESVAAASALAGPSAEGGFALLLAAEAVPAAEGDFAVLLADAASFDSFSSVSSAGSMVTISADGGEPHSHVRLQA